MNGSPTLEQLNVGTGSMARLSIVIPVYNVEDTLERCLQSIVGQTFSDMEVIIVDDGSPDHCPQMCDEWAEKDSRIRVIHKENGGLSDARNAGIDMAQGEFITFVDSDDYLDLDTYVKVMNRAADTGADIVEFPVYRFYGSKQQQRLTFAQTAYDDMGDYWLKGRAYDHTYAWNKVYRRQLFGDDVRFPKGRVFEDVATLPKLLKKTKRVATTGEGLYYYCANSNGITATASGEQLNMLLEGHLEVLREHPDYINDDVYYLHMLNIQIDVCRLTGRKAQLPHRSVNPLSHGLSMKQRLKAALQDIIKARGIALIGMADTRFIAFVTLFCSLPAIIMFIVNDGLAILNPRTIAAMCLIPMLPALMAWVMSCIMTRWTKTQPWIKVTTYTTCIALMAVNIFLVLNFGTMVTPAMLMLLGETNGNESTNFISTYGLTGSSIVAYLLTLAAIVVAVKIKTKAGKIGKKAALLLFVALLGGTYQVWKTGQMMTYRTQADLETWYWNKGIYCANNTLTGLLYSYHMLDVVAADNVMAMTTNRKASKMAATTTLGACDTLHIVLVIGESYSKRHAAIYGYDLDTTPRQQEALDSGCLFVFTDAVSPYNMTTMAVRNMLSTNSLSMDEEWSEKPLLTVLFKRADYHVMMWDNQMGQNGNVSIQDFTLSSLLHNNEMRQMAYTQYNTTTNDLDMPFADSCLHATNLQQHCHTLAIYHLAGQHFAARNHYPSDGSYDVFSYKDIRRNDLSEAQRQEIAEYDNATRYNDAVIGHIMDYYRHTPAVMIYLSDHGEEVYDYRHFIGRSHEKNKSPEAIRCQYEIPMTIWSNSFKQQYPELVKAIATAASKPFMADNLPHMLLDMAAIETPYYNEKKDMLSRSYRCGTRLIQNTTDYDQAIKR